MSFPGDIPGGFPTDQAPVCNPGTLTVTRAWKYFFQTIWNRTGAALGSQTVPPGTVVDFAGPPSNIPPGWLACGQTVSRTTYNNLFAAIGTTWGIGDGATTFALPPQAIFTKGLGADVVGATGGASSTTIAVNQLPPHNHPVIDPGHLHAITDPGHMHTALVTDAINTTGTNAGATQAGNTGSAMTGISINTAVTGVTTGVVGTGGAVPTMPPYGTFLKIIKT